METIRQALFPDAFCFLEIRDFEFPEFAEVVLAQCLDFPGHVNSRIAGEDFPG